MELCSALYVYSSFIIHNALNFRHLSFAYLHENEALNNNFVIYSIWSPKTVSTDKHKCKALNDLKQIIASL